MQWKCAVCGQVFEGEAPPVPCPICGAGESAFSEIVSAESVKWRCTVCGQTFDCAKPPVPCPICGAGDGAFVKEVVSESIFRLDTDDRFIIVGGGAAALEAAKAIRARNKTASIKMICGEGVIPYNRPALSDVVGDGLSFEAIVLQEYSWYSENRIELLCEVKCTAVNPNLSFVTLSDGRELTYTKLLLATGANAFIPPIKTDGSIKTAALRVFTDAVDLLENTKNKSVIVVGCGILGVEAALALRERGCSVSIVELAERVMSLQADDYMSEVLKKALVKLNISVYTEKSIDRIENSEAILTGGEKLSSELVLMCVGIRADISLAKDAGLLTQRGIIINSNMQTSDINIYAAGDCAQLDGKTFGLYSAAIAGGQAAGAAMAGDDVNFAPPPAATSFEGAGINMFSAGILSGARLATLVYNNDETGVYKKLVYDGKALVGAVLSKDLSEAADIMDAIAAKRAYSIKI